MPQPNSQNLSGPPGSQKISNIAELVQAMVDAGIGGDVTIANFPAVMKSPFGEPVYVTPKPISYIKGTYGMNENVGTYLSGNGTASVSGVQFVANAPAGAPGESRIYTNQPVVYLPGVGVMARGTGLFETGSNDNDYSMFGLISPTDGLAVGVMGNRWAVKHWYNGVQEVRTLTFTVGTGGTETITVTLDGVAVSGSITAGSTTHVAHNVAAFLTASALVNNEWYFQHINTGIVCTRRSAKPNTGAYSVASTGTAAGAFVQNAAGQSPTKDAYFQDQSEWIGDDTSWMDSTKGNLFQVQFGYLGYGDLEVWAYKPLTGWIKVHTIEWANLKTEPSFINPSLHAGWIAYNETNEPATATGANAATFLLGDGYTFTPASASGSQAGVTTESQVLTIQVRNEFASKAFRGVVVPTEANLSTTSSVGAIFRLYKNPIVAGDTAHAYTDQTNEPILYDTAGTTVTGGRKLGTYIVGPNGRVNVDLTKVKADCGPNDELVWTAERISGAAADMTVSMILKNIM